ncbi:hypothetical protein, partial [Streptomyces hainanensis]
MVTVVVLGAAGCGTADSLEPDGGPRPALTSDASPEEGPEPDHLATRMRRHADGLVLLSGAAPARQWRKPEQL